jgi:adenylate cyclase
MSAMIRWAPFDPALVLLREMKRRHVFRVAFAYAGVSWAVIQVSSSFFPPLGIPDWALSLVAATLVLGFPVAMVLAWAYDITPAGVERTPAPPGTLEEEIRAARRPVAPADSAAAVPTPDRSSIAVLPFVDHGGAGEHRFLGDGLAEELIHGLADLPGLRVVARTSSFLFRGDSLDVREVGSRLGVGLVLEGSVRVTGSRVRLAAQLVDAHSGYALWSRVFAREIEDLLLLQEEVANRIVEALRVAIRGWVPVPLAGDAVLRGSTADVEAYTHFLRGRAAWYERTHASLAEAVREFETAVRVDPGFAQAYAGLADSFAILVDYGLLSPGDGVHRAGAAAARALELSPGLPDAHSSAALVLQVEGDLEGAEAGFRRALALQPRYGVARQRLALLLAWTARFEEAREHMELARDVDPISPILSASRAWIEYYAGSYDTAIEMLLPVVSANPRLAAARVPLALAWLGSGRPGEAVSLLREAMDRGDGSASVLALHGYALGRTGDTAGAARQLADLRGLGADRYVSSYYLAIATLGVGDADGALHELRRAADEGAAQLVYLEVEPIFDPLRDDPDFRAITRQVRRGSVPLR